MSTRTENMKVTDRMGFVHEIQIKHDPDIGLSRAFHDDMMIASREYGSMREPLSDNEREWERYEELFGEWSDAAKVDLSIACKFHFDKKLPKV